MAVSEPVTFPSVDGIQVTEMRLKNTVGKTQSPFTGAQNYYDFGGAWWRARFEISRLADRSNADEWTTTLTKIRGKLREFKAGPQQASSPKGTGGGSPTVDSVNSAQDEITSSGWDASETVLEPGDYIEVNGELKRCLDTVSSDGSGNATFDVEPPFRADPSSNSIITSSPQTTWRLVENTASWTVRVNTYTSIVFEAVESF